MSAFLGKIHYWLFNKIQLHERLIDEIIRLANSKGYNADSLISESHTRYGYPVTGALEDEIEHSNIHGWLQERIISVESRLAYVVTDLLKNNIVTTEEIANVFYNNAVDIEKEINIKNNATPQEYFNLVFDYMLDGMPCDRVNEMVENTDNNITWETTTCLHRDYWEQVEGDISNFYYFRNSWINGLLDGSGYEYVRTENGINTIRKV